VTVVPLHSEPQAEAALDVGVSHALLEQAREAVRVWRPASTALSLGRLDVRSPRAAELAPLARAAGGTPVRRLAGGRAAIVDPGCLCVGWVQPEPVLAESQLRYRVLARAIVGALADVGVAARLGEVAGEWCPGAMSVQGPNGKLAGLAQRVVSGAAWCEALIVIERAPALHLLGERVHALLGIPWRSDAQGELAALLGAGRDAHAELRDALVLALRRQWPALDERLLPTAVRGRAAELAAEHRWP
jgi:octanoyl-[GcvH]:protein N-octanoyltransferase